MVAHAASSQLTCCDRIADMLSAPPLKNRVGLRRNWGAQEVRREKTN